MQGTPRPWGRLIPAFLAGQMTEGTASHAILVHPSSCERLHRATTKLAILAEYVPGFACACARLRVRKAIEKSGNQGGQMPKCFPQGGKASSPAADPLAWVALANAAEAV